MKRLLAVLCGIALIAGCDSKLLGSLPNAQMAPGTGRAVVSIAKESQSTQATFSDINRIDFSLSSAGLSIPEIRTISRSNLSGGAVNATFEAIPVGTATIKVTAYDNTSVNIGQATASVLIEEGRTSNVAIPLKLVPTYVSTDAKGTASAQITVIDGDVIEVATASQSPYDPKIDQIVRMVVFASTKPSTSNPDTEVLIALSIRGYDNAGSSVYWESGDVKVDYAIFTNGTDRYNPVKGQQVASGKTNFTSWTTERLASVSKQTGQYGVVGVLVQLPNGKSHFATTDGFKLY